MCVRLECGLRFLSREFMIITNLIKRALTQPPQLTRANAPPSRFSKIAWKIRSRAVRYRVAKSTAAGGYSWSCVQSRAAARAAAAAVRRCSGHAYGRRRLVIKLLPFCRRRRRQRAAEPAAPDRERGYRPGRSKLVLWWRFNCNLSSTGHAYVYAYVRVPYIS